MPDSKDSKPETIEEAQARIVALEADVEKWKTLSRKNEDRAKENAEAAKERDAAQVRVGELEGSRGWRQRGSREVPHPAPRG